jgi:hypothetical protein
MELEKAGFHAISHRGSPAVCALPSWDRNWQKIKQGQWLILRLAPRRGLGYGIDVFGKGNHWHYSARPIVPTLPVLMPRARN